MITIFAILTITLGLSLWALFMALMWGLIITIIKSIKEKDDDYDR